MPAYNGITYAVFGDRNWLDLMQWHGSHDFMNIQAGPAFEIGSGGYRDNFGVSPSDGNTYHYWGLLTNCCQTRGSNWLIRDVLWPASVGRDPNVAYPDGTFNTERAMFSDMIKETSNYWPIFSKFKDGPGNTNWTTSIWPIANNTIGDNSIGVTVFQVGYSMLATYELLAFQHVPMGGIWGTGMQKFMEGVVGMQLPGMGHGPGLISSYYMGSYAVQPAMQFADPPPGGSLGFRGNIGQWLNGVDATDFGYFSSDGTNILTGGQLQIVGTFHIGQPQVGDTLKDMDPWYGYPNIDQFQGGNRWYDIMGPIQDNGGSWPTFYVRCNAADHIKFPAQCPVAGQAFTGFTRGGGLQENVRLSEVPKFRFQYDPGPGQGYDDFGYGQYIGNVINALHILGYNVSHATADYASRCPADVCYDFEQPSFWWDPTIVVPGLPTAVNAIPGN